MPRCYAALQCRVAVMCFIGLRHLVRCCLCGGIVLASQDDIPAFERLAEVTASFGFLSLLFCFVFIFRGTKFGTDLASLNILVVIRRSRFHSCLIN